MTPSQAPAGVVRNVNRFPRTGSNPDGGMNQRAISSPDVSARQIVAARCVPPLTAASLMVSLLQKGAEIGEPLAPEDAVVAHPVEKRGQSLGFGVVENVAALR